MKAMKSSPFFKQAELMLRTLPYIAAEKCFALKGGTAINLFVRDMPRLSVDVDLTYLPIEPREESLKKIAAALVRIAAAIEKTIPMARVQAGRIPGDKKTAKLFVRTPEAQIKIEPNPVIRGAIFPSSELTLSKKAEELFELSVSIKTLSLADLYGGKLCAALDRQHPRDLFDVYLLMKTEGITDDIRKAFVIYLASHDRPINELIDPVRKDIRRIFENELQGMTSVHVRFEDLLDTREKLISVLRNDLTGAEKSFLVSIKEMNPQWGLLALDGIERLPALQWKLANVSKMNPKKRAEALAKLKAKLGL
jgi:predicted nucleotidyltransferase component of viral defense system